MMPRDGAGSESSRIVLWFASIFPRRLDTNLVVPRRQRLRLDARRAGTKLEANGGKTAVLISTSTLDRRETSKSCDSIPDSPRQFQFLITSATAFMLHSTCAISKRTGLLRLVDNRIDSRIFILA
jgi:hypothetical protein